MQSPSATEATGTATAGERFARAIAAKDAAALRAVFAGDLDFQALTPRRTWSAATPGEAVDDVILGHWFGPEDDVRELVEVTTGSVEGRGHVGYRVRVTTDGQDHLVEQQAYYDTDGAGAITWMRVVCSGYRPLR